MKKIFICIALILLSQLKILAQVDPHFSQFYAYPLWLNPGLTGVMDGDYRVTGLYRNQWRNVTAPFSTMGFSAEVATNKNLNLGANIISQSAGDGGYKYLNVYATIAYSGIRFGTDLNQQVTIGIQAGMLSRRFDPSKFQFGDQWNPVTGYNPAVASADLIAGNSSSVLDVGSGISYMDNTPGKQVNFFGGFAAFHLTQPEDPFINGSIKRYLPVRYAIHAGANITLSETTSITPNALYLQQGNATEKMIGIYSTFKANDMTNLMLGVNYRFEDAVSPFAGIGFKDFVLGLSYDVNDSPLGKAVAGTNSLEVSLSWTGRKAGKPLRYLSCPRL
ncbi:MAG: PorP/SprF family type IX secretion system membrane protein [Bacteroidota bacterium]|nr:PorP/SprF family type IX secretion system membrane protein [Bacteroidota bacterium]